MQIYKECANDCSQGIEVERNLGHVKYRHRIIGKLISIEVLWESFHPNTLIKNEL